MISEVEKGEGGSKSKERGGGRPGHGSWASRGIFRPKSSTNEVRNFLQLFVACGAGGEIRPGARSAAAPWRGASLSARPCRPWVPPQRLQQAQGDRRQLRERPG